MQFACKLARILFPVAVMLLAVAGCGRSNPQATDASLTRVTLQLNWFPEHEHGGFYAAVLHGYYQQAGLDVRILPGGPKVAAANQLVAGRADFALASADEVLLARGQNARLVALLAPLDESPRCIMVRRDSGIDAFEGLGGTTLAVSVGSPFAVFLQQKGYLRDVKVVPYFGGIGQFVANPKYAQQAYSFSEPILAEREGTPATTLMLADLGFNPYMGLLVTLDKTVEERNDVAAKFVEASLRGWRHYLTEPDKTNHHLAALNSSLDRELLAEGVIALRPLCREPMDTEFGKMDPGRWETLAQQLVELKLLAPGKVIPTEAFTNDLVERSQEGP